MQPLIQEKLPLLHENFAKNTVYRAWIFGSAAGNAFNAESDVDILIEFEKGLELVEQGEKWWTLYEALQKALNRRVDLLTMKSLKNPFFIEEIEATKKLIYGKAD